MPLPNPLSRAELNERGRTLVERFCSRNNLPCPPYGGPPRAYRNRYQSCGLYADGVIYVDPTKCASIGTGGPAWSYPGHLIDRTPYGVHAHECGHFLDELLNRPGDGSAGAYRAELDWSGDFSRTLRRETQELPITNYAPNAAEWFAELVRLFLTNPDLLRLVRPRVYEALCAHFPHLAEGRPWEEVLAGAPPRTLVVVRKRIREAQSSKGPAAGSARSAGFPGLFAE